MVSQEQEEVQTPVSTEATVATTTIDKKKAKRKTKLVNAEDVMPKPSLWPLLLAVAIAVALFGVLSHPIVLGVGALLVVVTALGWILERR